MEGNVQVSLCIETEIDIVARHLTYRHLFNPRTSGEQATCASILRSMWEMFRKVHDEGLHNSYRSLIIIWVIKSRRMRWAGRMVRMVEKRNASRVLVGSPEGKGHLGRRRCKWEFSIRLDFKEI